MYVVINTFICTYACSFAELITNIGVHGTCLRVHLVMCLCVCVCERALWGSSTSGLSGGGQFKVSACLGLWVERNTHMRKTEIAATASSPTYTPCLCKVSPSFPGAHPNHPHLDATFIPLRRHNHSLFRVLTCFLSSSTLSFKKPKNLLNAVAIFYWSIFATGF